MEMVKKLFFPCIIAILTVNAAADDWLRSMPEFKLTDHLGEIHTLDTYQEYDLAVFYVQGVGCPIARIALPNYREVREEYANKNIAFTKTPNSFVRKTLKRFFANYSRPGRHDETR